MDFWVEGSYTAEEVLEPSESHLETCDEDFVQTTRLVAKQVAARGDYAKAEAMLRTSLKAQERVYGTDTTEYLRALFELCIVVSDLQKFEEARSLYLDVVEARTRVLGPNHPYTINAMSGLADTYRRLGQYDESEALYQETLLRADDVLGMDDYKTLVMRHNLALLYDALGRPKDAEPIYQICIEGLEAQCHPHDRNLLVVKENFAKNQDRLGNIGVAERAFCDALDGMVESMGVEHPIARDTMETLAWFYESNKRYEKALPLFHQLYEVTAKKHGENHESALLMHLNVARNYCHLGDNSEALTRVKATVAAWNTILQETDKKLLIQPGEEKNREQSICDLLCAQQLLARCYHFESLYDESEQLLLEIIPSLRSLKSTGTRPASSMLPLAVQYLGELYIDLNRYDEAENFLATAVKEYGEDVQYDHEYLGRLCKVLLGRALGYQGKTAESSRVFQEAMDMPKDSRTISKLQEADIMVKIALFYEDIDEWAEAFKLMKMALEIREERLGEGHKETLVPLQALGLCSEMLDHSEEAMYWYERAIIGMQEVYGFHFKDLHQVVTNWTRVCMRLGNGKEEQIPPRLEEYRDHGVYFELVRGSGDGLSNEGEEEAKKEDDGREAQAQESNGDAMRKHRAGAKFLRSRL